MEVRILSIRKFWVILALIAAASIVWTMTSAQTSGEYWVKLGEYKQIGPDDILGL